jgi:two-component system cell cycle sensor histidine kinase PleC
MRCIPTVRLVGFNPIAGSWYITHCNEQKTNTKKIMNKTHKILSSIVGLILLMTVVGLSFWTFNQIKEAAVARRHTLLVILQAEKLLSQLKDAETSQRGYALTGDETFLEPYSKVRDSITVKLEELRQMTTISAAVKEVDTMEPLIAAKLAELSQSIQLRRSNDTAGIGANVGRGKGKRLMDSIRVAQGSFITIQEHALAQNEAELQANLRFLFINIVATSLISLLFVLVLAYLINREAQRRLKDLVHLETQHLLTIQEDVNKQLQQVNSTLQISEEKFAVTLNSIGDAVMATDGAGKVTLLNPLAEKLTGWQQEEAIGHPVEEIFHIINEETRQPSPDIVKGTLLNGATQIMTNHTILISRSGGERAIADSCAPIRDRAGQVIGAVLVFRDVTDRMEIEMGMEKTRKELEIIKRSADEASEFAESVINTVREPLISLDQDLRVVTASRSFYEVFKVNPKETEGQLIYDLGNKQWDIPKLRELLETILPQQATFDNYEVEHDFTTIGRRTMLLNARQIHRVWGKEKIILLAIEDITERRKIENGLEKARKELETIKISEDAAREYSESIINTVREPLITLNQDLRVVSVSRSFYEVFKVNPEETVGQLIYDLGNKQWNIPKLRELLETILPQKASFDNYEVEHNFTTIGRRTMLLNARQIQRVSGKERIILLAIADITERREIENGLEKARKELETIKISEDAAREYSESIINTVRESLIALDQDLRVVSVSRSFYEVFKVNPEETVGQLIYDLGNKQWNIPKLRELLETILPQKASFDNYEVEHNFTTIGQRIMLLNARQIQRVSGKERIILLAIEDITVRREIENGLEKAHEELKELAAELKRTARVKSEFLANMSHELRTPLNSINGFSEVLFDETFGPLNEKQKKYVNNVLTSGKHLLLLINQILDMAKVEAGKMKLGLSNLPMKNLLSELSMLVADMVSKKKLHMVTEIAEDLPNIDADELKVKEIIYNLLSNAVKFTPEGGQIGMRAKKTDSVIEVVVWDTGVGIAPENMEKVFEGFFRVDTPYSRLTEGTGLGLPLSKKLVELHGGKFSIESEGLGRGTSVRFSLPIVSGMVV